MKILLSDEIVGNNMKNKDLQGRKYFWCDLEENRPETLESNHHRNNAILKTRNCE